MKKYTHKSGKYIAEQSMYGEYQVTLLRGNGTDIDRLISTFPKQCSELIENSKDWIEMIEVSVGEYFSKSTIDNAIRMATNYTSYNTTGIKHLTVSGVLDNFKIHFFNLLKNVQ